MEKHKKQKQVIRIFIFENVALQDGINEVKAVANQDGVVSRCGSI